MKFTVELLENTYDVEADSWQSAKYKAAKLYKEETGIRKPIAFLAPLARARKQGVERYDRVLSLEELLK